jgi:glyoxylase-like metal-dependent hydrolase (beta-lactamase superfamily II)
VRQVAAGVFVVAGSRDAASPDNGGAVGNLGFIATPAGTVIINAGGSYGLGRRLIALAERHAGRPVVAAVITQARPEFVMGMAAFTDRGIEVIAHEATARLIVQRCAECLRRLRDVLGDEAMSGTRLVAPTRTLGGSSRLAPGGRRIELLHLGTAQTAGDLVVVDVDSGVAFAGAVVSERRIPELEDAGGAAPWRGTLAALAALPLRRLVPGYGESGAAAPLIAATDAYLARLALDVQAEWDRGTDLLTAQRALTLPAWRGWAEYERLHARNVQREYLAAEARWMAAPR